MTGLDDWVLENTSRVVADLERHGFTVTWSEAHERLMDIARFLIRPPVPAGDSVQVDVADSCRGGLPTPVDLAEEAVSTYVHFNGRAYFPVDPEHSNIGIAVPWDIAGQLCTRLSLLLQQRIASGDSASELAELAVLVVATTGRIADTLEMFCDDEGTSDERVEGCRYLLLRSRDVWQAEQLLRTTNWDTARDDVELAEAVGPGLLDDLTDESELHAFLWDLDWWITGSG